MSGHLLGLFQFLTLMTAVPAVLACVVFSRVPWWRSGIGRHVMSYMLVAAGTFSLSAVSSRIPRDAHNQLPMWFGVLFLAVYACYPVVMWWRLVVLIRARGWHDEPTVDAETLAAIDQVAADQGVTRAEVIRRLGSATRRTRGLRVVDEEETSQ